MYETTKGIVLNLIDLIDTYGYVLNGARTYYTNRSQPPLLSSMVIEVYKQTNDVDLVKKALPVLIKEHKFWNSGIHNVTIEDSEGLTHNLNRWNLTYLSWPLLLEKAAMLYTLLEIQNQERRPWTLFFGMKKKDNGLITGSTIVLTKWDAANQNQNSFVSNFIPLWVQLFNSDETVVNKVAQSIESSELVRAASIATSLTNSSEQWDFPNGWAPIQHMIVEGVVRSGSKEARSLAKDLAIRWIRTNYAAYKSSKTMHEKYDVCKCGEFGGGGEYVPQMRHVRFGMPGVPFCLEIVLAFGNKSWRNCRCEASQTYR